VASDLGAFRRVLGEGAYGVLVPRGDSQALAGALCDLIADAPRRDELTSRASAAVQRYDWSRVTERVLEVYQTVCSGAPAAVTSRTAR
jgi:phosphatidylinositol alpha-mannosyltransferase